MAPRSARLERELGLARRGLRLRSRQRLGSVGVAFLIACGTAAGLSWVLERLTVMIDPARGRPRGQAVTMTGDQRVEQSGHPPTRRNKDSGAEPPPGRPTGPKGLADRPFSVKEIAMGVDPPSRDAHLFGREAQALQTIGAELLPGHRRLTRVGPSACDPVRRRCAEAAVAVEDQKATDARP